MRVRNLEGTVALSSSMVPTDEIACVVLLTVCSRLSPPADAEAMAAGEAPRRKISLREEEGKREAFEEEVIFER